MGLESLRPRRCQVDVGLSSGSGVRCQGAAEPAERFVSIVQRLEDDGGPIREQPRDLRGVHKSIAAIVGLYDVRIKTNHTNLRRSQSESAEHGVKTLEGQQTPEPAFAQVTAMQHPHAHDFLDERYFRGVEPENPRERVRGIEGGGLEVGLTVRDQRIHLE